MAKIDPIDEDLFRAAFWLAGNTDLESIPPTFSALTFEMVQSEVAAAGLVLPAGLLLDAVAALDSGKHLMIRGAPGTGKTTLALALGRAATRAGLTIQPMLTTATADWTSVDTVGAYRLTSGGALRFQPGHVLDGMRDNRWVIVDELNRSDIDKAIGQLFTVLSGHPVTLPFVVDPTHEDWTTLGDPARVDEAELPGVALHVSIVPVGASVPEDSVPIHVSASWRLIATLNDRDRDLLFDMSEALKRRFAVLDVHPPTPSEWSEILVKYGRVGRKGLDGALHELVSGDRLNDHPLGPAVILDAARHARSLLTTAELAGNTLDDKRVLQGLLDAYINPHLSDASIEVIDAVDLLDAAVDADPSTEPTSAESE